MEEFKSKYKDLKECIVSYLREGYDKFIIDEFCILDINIDKVTLIRYPYSGFEATLTIDRSITYKFCFVFNMDYDPEEDMIAYKDYNKYNKEFKHHIAKYFKLID